MWLSPFDWRKIEKGNYHHKTEISSYSIQQVHVDFLKVHFVWVISQEAKHTFLARPSVFQFLVTWLGVVVCQVCGSINLQSEDIMFKKITLRKQKHDPVFTSWLKSPTNVNLQTSQEYMEMRRISNHDRSNLKKGWRMVPRKTWVSGKF